MVRTSSTRQPSNFTTVKGMAAGLASIVYGTAGAVQLENEYPRPMMPCPIFDRYGLRIL